MTRGGRGGYPRGGGSRGGSSYRGGGSYRGSSDHHGGSSYNDRDNSRNRYSGGGGSYGDSRSSRYDTGRYSRQDDHRQGGGYKRNESYKDSRDRRSPDRKRPRTDHSSQGGRRDYGSGSSGGDYHRREGSGASGRGGSSSRYHDGGSSSYDKRGNEHHSSSVGSSGGGGGGAGRDRLDNRSSSRGRGGSDRSREPMGPPRSVGPRNIRGRGPPMGGRSSMGARDSFPMSTIRRGSTRGRLTSRFRNDGRRGMITSRMGARRDMGIPPPRRNFRPIRGGRNDGLKRMMKIRNTPYTDNTKVSRKALIKRALAAAKELDDDHTTENEGEDDDEEIDDEEKDILGAEDVDVKKEPKEDEEEDDGDKTVKDEEEDEDAEADKTVDTEDKEGHDDKADETKEGEEGEGEKKDAPSTPKKGTKKVVASVKGTPSSEKSVVSKESDKKKKDTRITTKYHRSYIKLDCCHCDTKCITFKEYAAHLFRGLHRAAMRRLAGQTREKLMEMRQTQRAAQKEADEKVEEGSEQKSSYCPLCQLNFRQPKAVHQKSSGHQEMKRFLMPYCATCKIGFKSPMAYEGHRASLDHLKFKARVERYAKDDSGEDGAEIDLENFTTVDEVGNVDEPTDSIKDNASTPKKGASTGHPGTDDEDDSDDVDDETVIGGEHVKKVEVQYCDLCSMYLPRREDPEKIVAIHCKTRSHLKLYIRQREDKKLRERAERIHKKKLSDAKAKKEAKKEKDASVSEADASEKPDSDEKKAGEGETKDSTTDDQLWEVVDNDIGDLLREVGGPGEDAEEEEDEEKASSERYDKFKHTEKNGLEKANIHDSTAEEDEVSTTEKKAAAKKATNGDANGAEKEVKAEA